MVLVFVTVPISIRNDVGIVTDEQIRIGKERREHNRIILGILCEGGNRERIERRRSGHADSLYLAS